MSGAKSYKCHNHKRRNDFRIISEIRQWIIDFWYNFIKRLKNVLSERRLSRIQSEHTKSIVNISAHFNAHTNAEKTNIHHVLAPRIKSPVKPKKSRKHKKKIDRTEIFEELSDDYLALYNKKSFNHLTPTKTSSIIVDKKRSSCSTKSRKSSRHSQINIIVQEVTQKFVDDGCVDLNWLPKLFGCVIPPTSTSRISLPKITNNLDDNHHVDSVDKLEQIKITNDFKKYSKIPRYQYPRSAVIKSKPKIPYSKHHQNCINNN